MFRLKIQLTYLERSTQTTHTRCFSFIWLFTGLQLKSDEVLKAFSQTSFAGILQPEHPAGVPMLPQDFEDVIIGTGGGKSQPMFLEKNVVRREVADEKRH